ncbi:AP-4 complex subunit epsilon-like [Stylophora pistillata]|uniref:AP-4 complex subunit epsilon-like n=1 Tax=Stylophora pistillata TaxID=50429 RepID=UPI000C054FF7|nr:AP-4 complex subunit epsilon-like [Stylophora pistillata]
MASKGSGSLPSFISGYYGPSSSSSRAFESLVRAIGEAKSKQDEDRIAKKELGVLKDKLMQPDTSAKQMREYLVRLIYCEMLGHHASFGYVEAIKFAQQSNLLYKRVGYLAVSLFLHENHELIVLLINTIQKDLHSTNVAEVCYALTVLCKLINKDMMPALLPQVLELVQNKRDIIRKKAIMALQSLYRKNPSAIPNVKELAMKATCDKDPGVVSSSLHVFYELVKAEPSEYKDLVSGFISLQKAILEGKIAKEYDYHGVAAPWIQMKNLRLMALLGADDQKTSKKLYPILGSTLSKLHTNSLISYAVAYECTRTITSIYPDKSLIDKAARCVGLFLVAKTNDIKYLGINILTSLIQMGSGFVMEPSYQRIVIDCLDDPDETLKRKTLDLLCHITNASNVETVCEKLLSYLKSTTDSYFRTELVDRTTELAERYAPDNTWFILTINEVFELGGSLVREGVAHNLMRLLAEGNEDEEADNEIRRFAVLSYINLLEKPVLPDILVWIICWVLGEYSYTAPEYEPAFILEQLFSLMDRTFQDPSTKAWIVTAVGKLTSQVGQMCATTRDWLEKHVSGVDVELRQRCSEIQKLSENTFLMQSVLPIDGCCEDLEVDESLSFLDDVVSEALSKGASPYKALSERRTAARIKDVPESEPTLKFTPYENPMDQPRKPPAESLSNSATQKKPKPRNKETKMSDTAHSQVKEAPSTSTKLFAGKAVWGPGGYAKDRAQSGSLESGSKSDSSSRSSGSERQIALKSHAEVSSASPVTSHQDVRKQQLAAQLFSGVKEKPRLSSGRGHVNKITKNPGKPRTSATHPGLSSANNRAISSTETGLKASDKSNMDLLLDIENSDICDVAKEDASSLENDLISSFHDAEDELSSRDEAVSGFSQESIDSDSCMAMTRREQEDGYQAIQKNTPLLDVEITEHLPRLELKGTPSASLPEDLINFPHSAEVVELCFDSNVRVTLQKVWKPLELVLVLYITNQNQANAPIHDVSSVLQPPSNLIGSFDSSSSSNLHDESIGPLEWVRHQVVLKYQSPALHMNFGGKISYKDPNRTVKHLFFNHTLSIGDILRPLVITTEEYGQKWAEASFEKKQKMPSSLKTYQELAERVKDVLRFHQVDAVGTKAIFAGTVMECGICLMHVSFSGTEFDLSIKSNNRLLNDALMKQCVPLSR